MQPKLRRKYLEPRPTRIFSHQFLISLSRMLIRPRFPPTNCPMFSNRDSPASSPGQAHDFPLAPSVAFANSEMPLVSLDALPTALSDESLGALPVFDDGMADFSTELPAAPSTSSQSSWSPEISIPNFALFDSASATHTLPTLAEFDSSPSVSRSVDQSSFADGATLPPNLSSPLVTKNDLGNSNGLTAIGNLPISIELVTTQTQAFIAEAVENATAFAEQVVEDRIDEQRAIGLAKESQRRACLRR